MMNDEEGDRTYLENEVEQINRKWNTFHCQVRFFPSHFNKTTTFAFTYNNARVNFKASTLVN